MEASFASEVIRDVSFGFAAGCEAVAMPRQRSHITAGLCPGAGLALRTCWAKGRTEGVAQKCPRHVHGGA